METLFLIAEDLKLKPIVPSDCFPEQKTQEAEGSSVYGYPKHCLNYFRLGSKPTFTDAFQYLMPMAELEFSASAQEEPRPAA